MKEERMQVLTMLGEGKISAAEAERLLDLLTKPNKGDRKEKAADFSAEFVDKATQFNEKVESLVKEFAGKLETVAKDVEPKLKKATQIIIEKTVATVDEISKTFHEAKDENTKDENESDTTVVDVTVTVEEDDASNKN